MRYLIRTHKKRCIALIVIGTILIYVAINIFITFHTRHGSRKPSFMQKYLYASKLKFKEENMRSLIGSKFQACVHPNLPLWSKEFKTYFEKVKPVKCTEDTDWVYTGSGKFYISRHAVDKYGEITCAYVPIVNSNDTFRTLKPIVPMLNGSALVSDAFKVSCKSADGNKYANIHACIAPTTNRIPHEVTPTSDRYNVLIFGFDSLSRQMFMRLLPKTHTYFTEILGGSLLEGYNIVGDGTTQALLPLLTGKRETEIPEVRRGKPGARHVDELLDFVWKQYEKKGYVTQWAEDLADIGTFNFRMLGFKDQPVNHYMRPFYLAATPIYPYFSRYCLGSRTRHQVYLDWLKEGLETNNDKNFFTFGFFSEYTHSNNNPAILSDEENVAFLEYLRGKNILDKAFLIVMSDHGTRYGSIRMTEQGKLEERMPYFGVSVPPAFQTKFPEKYKTFLNNTKRLSVPSDIHETLLDIIGESSTKSEINRTVYSLFSPIPKDRTCADAAIETHWCACLKSKVVSVSDPNVLSSVKTIISRINDILRGFTSLCHLLSLRNIFKSVSFETDRHVLRFKKSRDVDGRVPDLSDTLLPEIVHYQITFETVPGNAVFEATAFMNLVTGDVIANEREISRLNRYNDAPKCIEKSHPSLRPYCYCR
ncbi:uncharacterized protein LOC123555243 [Mercenaria mercenaria]|uniref:uncharacterized protein LOC123555243 n=1 Tax=Mercenaria mercenaria TaxID=6596 RepID=UPI00234EA7DF|nr:uncharacterized protein LOC123555243 [Mercenaria mercenaria]